MKRNILIIGLLVLVVSCSNESKMKSVLQDYMNKNSKDPYSYEYMDLKVIDTIQVAEFAKKTIDFNNVNQNFCDSVVVNFEADADKVELDYLGENMNTPQKHREQLKDAIETLKKGKAENLKMHSFLTSKDVLIYFTIHKFRAKNGFGALDLDSIYVQFDKDFKLLSVSKEKLYPGDINTLGKSVLKNN